jgi:hypothetical protein
MEIKIPKIIFSFFYYFCFGFSVVCAKEKLSDYISTTCLREFSISKGLEMETEQVYIKSRPYTFKKFQVCFSLRALHIQ